MLLVNLYSAKSAAACPAITAPAEGDVGARETLRPVPDGTTTTGPPTETPPLREALVFGPT